MKPELKGYERVRLQPKLQMVTNGDEKVNTCRAEYMSGLRLRPGARRRSIPAPRREALATSAASEAEALRPYRREKLRSVPTDIEANVFIQLAHDSEELQIPEELSRSGRIVRARVPLSRLPELARHDHVSFIELGESLQKPRVKKARAKRGPQERSFGDPALHKYGEDVLIGIVDVEGFDFSHADFLDSQGKTRFVRIWDQGGDARPSPQGKQFDYGAEFTQEHLNKAVQAAPTVGVPPYEIERQSQLVEGSHGTHVASIAAGNHGVCRRAAIAGVLIDVPQEQAENRRVSFYDSTRLADAVDYLLRLAGALKKKAVSINISLGTNGHAHDGSGAIGRYLDVLFSEAGKALTVAAGNAGQEEGEAPDDLGWVMGRIHTSGRVPAPQLVTDIEWVVVGNGRVDVSENELELWFSSQDHFGVSVRTPWGEWTEVITPLEYVENRRLPAGSFLSIYNELHHPSNGSNYIAVYLSPNLKADPIVGIPAGTWVVRLHGLEVRDGRFDGWIERDDPQVFDVERDRELWAFPSYFSMKSMVDNATVTSLGCGNRVVTVANLDETRSRIHITSSQGPSRDGRTKPDIAAPGTDIIAAKAFSTDGTQWTSMTGTSMASPFVTGVAGLMLAVEPRLTGAQIEGILRSTARPLPGATFAWANDAGYGVIDPEACLHLASILNQRKDRTKAAGGGNASESVSVGQRRLSAARVKEP